MTISQVLHTASQRLGDISTSPFLDAEILLSQALGVSRTELLMYGDKELEQIQIKNYDALIAERKNGKPVAYILGHKEFYGREFMVDSRVLIPRPETELIIDAAKRIVATIKEPIIVDVGTGSGVIACTLQLELPNAELAATDISKDSLEVAHENAARLRAHITFSHGDLYEAFPESLKGRVDLIISNPPYLDPEQLTLEIKETKALKYEPAHALTPGEDAFEVIAQLITGASEWLSPTGGLLIEIGHDQGEQAIKAAKKAFPKHDVSVKKDLAGFDRILMVFVNEE